MDDPQHPAPMIRVIVCDDDADIRLLVRVLFAVDPAVDVVGEAGDGAEAVRVASEVDHDVVILNVGMPVLDGSEALGRIHDAVPRSKVVLFTGYERAHLRGWERSAAFVDKTGPLSDLLRAVKHSMTERAVA